MAIPLSMMGTMKLSGVAVIGKLFVTVAKTLTVSGLRQPRENIRHCSI